jgi:TM2 domain-containing membrane protein YozV/RNA polymerase subunit RPABC4/transcription elongation factor Spt4
MQVLVLAGIGSLVFVFGTLRKSRQIGQSTTSVADPARLAASYAALQKFCYACGAQIDARAEICPKCGVRQLGATSPLGATTPSGKNRIVAALFAIFLGSFGIHKFYLGRVGEGILYLLFCWTFIPALIGLIEGIIYIASSDAEFAAKYDYRSPGALAPPPLELTRQCPDCAETIKPEAYVCRFCGYRFSDEDVAAAVTRAREESLARARTVSGDPAELLSTSDLAQLRENLAAVNDSVIHALHARGRSVAANPSAWAVLEAEIRKRQRSKQP